MKSKVFSCVFFGAFIVAGLIVATLGFVRLGRYNYADAVEATVVSVDYEAGGADVVYEFERNGKAVQAQVRYDKVKFDYEEGRMPYYEGQKAELRVDGENNVLQFGFVEIFAIAVGCVFAAVGLIFLYLFVFRKQTLADVAYDYENAMVDPDDIADGTAKYEAVDDELSKLPKKSPERMFGETGVWTKRMRDRFLSFSVWEHLLYGGLLIVPPVVLCLLPLFFGKSVTSGHIASCLVGWLFAYCILGLLAKGVRYVYLKILVRRGKFTEKRHATVVRCAFESSAYYQVGEFSRTHTIFKKFRVVATVDGKRSVGFVKGNVPPPRGATLKVLIRPNKPKKWVIDNS